MLRSTGLLLAFSLALAGCNLPEESAPGDNLEGVSPVEDSGLVDPLERQFNERLGGTGTMVSAFTVPVGGLSETANRDRLLDGLATIHGRANRCAEWNAMGPNQRGVFLTITDLLWGTYLYKAPYKRYLSTSSALGNCSMCQYPGYECRSGYECQTNGKTCMVYAPPYPQAYYSVCMDALALTYVNYTYTATQPRTGIYTEKMLDHVTQIYSMAAETTSCGGEDNRLYFSADDALIYALRNEVAFPVGWKNSGDLAGPHSPFTQSRETQAGKPRGQTHQFAWDSEVVSVQKSGMWTPVYDPHLVEIDMDYNWLHDSNPECFYEGEYGRTRYTNLWSSQGYPADLSYQPVCP